MSDYADVTDVINLKRQLTAQEQARAIRLIPIICSVIRMEAKKTGRDFDKMIYESELVPIYDVFNGNGTKTAFNLSYVPQSAVKVTVNENETSDYTINDKVLTFSTAPDGEILVIYEYRALQDVVKGVVCDVIMRELNTPGKQLPATSYSEGAGGVSQSYTLPNSSGSIKLWPSDLKALGLKRQKIDAIDLRTKRKGCF